MIFLILKGQHMSKKEKLYRFKEISNHCKKGLTLDLGCGLPNPYLKNVIGVDKNPNDNYYKLIHNYKKIINANLNYKFPFKDNYFENVIAGEIIEHIQHPLFFVMECRRVLKKGGKLIITTPNIYYYNNYIKLFRMDYNPYHIIEMPYYSLKKLYQLNEFKNIKIHGLFLVIPFIRILIKVPFWASKQILMVGEK